MNALQSAALISGIAIIISLSTFAVIILVNLIKIHRANRAWIKHLKSRLHEDV